MGKLKVKDIEITVVKRGGQDFVCLTDMIKAKDGDFFVSDWLRNRNTLEFLSVWEQLNNPDFNYGEFAIIASRAGLNNYKLSVKDWIGKTGAIGLTATTGRYGGTFAHKDIAFEFGMWISAEFKLLLITEYQKLKEEESVRINSGWDFRRMLSKTNYAIHTDAIKDNLVPLLDSDKAKYIFADEADVLNVALFGVTAKQWREDNKALHLQGLNIRDLADVHQLIVLSNLESNNAYLIGSGMSQYNRLLELRKIAVSQLKSLRNSRYAINKIESPFKDKLLNSKIRTDDKPRSDKTSEGNENII